MFFFCQLLYNNFLYQRRGGACFNFEMKQKSSMAVLLLLPVFVLLSCMIFWIFLAVRVCAGKPLQPTTTRNSQMRHPSSLQSAIMSAYLKPFLSCAFSQISSPGTASSIVTNVLVVRLVLDWFSRCRGKQISWLEKGSCVRWKRTTSHL